MSDSQQGGGTRRKSRRRDEVWLPVATARPSRRDELLAVAARLFAEHGFARVTVDEIGAASGVSGPALYHHFPSKEALLGEMLVSISEHLLAQGRHIVATTASHTGALNALIDAHATFAVSRPALITVHLRDLVHATEADRRSVRRLQRRYLELWVDVIREAVPAADDRVVRTAIHAAFGVLNSTAFGRALEGADMAALLRTLAARVLDVHALAAASAAVRRV